MSRPGFECDQHCSNKTLPRSPALWRWLFVLLLQGSQSYRLPFQQTDVDWIRDLIAQSQAKSSCGFEGSFDPMQCYGTHEEMILLLWNARNNYRHLMSMKSIGTSVEGRELMSIKLTNKYIKDPLKPRVKYVGNMHGDEAVSRQLMIKLALYLVENYNSSDLVRSILDTTEVHIVPTMNPDGFANSKEGLCYTHNSDSGSGFARRNANNVDLNRDFPVLNPYSRRKYQPETRAMIRWSKQTPFVLSANFHGGALIASYPLDFVFLNGSSRCPDDELVQRLARIYADNHLGGMAEGVTCSSNDPGYITNGADWYPIYGSMQDFCYFHTSSIDLTIEISCCKYPHRFGLPRYWNENKVSLLKFITAAHLGIKGFVLDSLTLGPIPHASITTENSKRIYTTDEGTYWKLLLPGTHQVTVKASGYNPLNVTVTVDDEDPFSAKKFDFVLERSTFTQ